MVPAFVQKCRGNWQLKESREPIGSKPVCRRQFDRGYIGSIVQGRTTIVFSASSRWLKRLGSFAGWIWLVDPCALVSSSSIIAIVLLKYVCQVIMRVIGFQGLPPLHGRSRDSDKLCLHSTFSDIASFHKPCAQQFTLAPRNQTTRAKTNIEASERINHVD